MSSPFLSIGSEIAPEPVQVGTATITLRLKDIAGRPVTRARITLEGDMSHAGMSPTFGEANEIDPGRYRGAIEFTMAGDWIILTRVRLADGQTVERQIKVNGVRAKL